MEITTGARLKLAGYRSPDGSLHPDGCGEHCYKRRVAEGDTPLWALDGSENNALKWGTANVPPVPGS